MINILNQILQQLGGSLTPQVAGAGPEGSANNGDSASSFAQSLFSFLGEQSAGGVSSGLIPASQAETADQSPELPLQDAPMPDGVLTPVYPHMWLHSSVLAKDYTQQSQQLSPSDGQTPSTDGSGLQVMALFKGASSEHSKPQMTLNVVDTSALQIPEGNATSHGSDLKLVNPSGNIISGLSGAAVSAETSKLTPQNGSQLQSAFPMDEVIKLEELAQTETGRKILQQIVQSDDLPEGIDLNKVKAILDNAETKAAEGLKLQRNVPESQAVKEGLPTREFGLKLVKNQPSESNASGVITESKVTTDEMSKRATLHELHRNLSVAQKEAVSNSTENAKHSADSSIGMLNGNAENANRHTGSGTDQNLKRQAQQGNINLLNNQNPATPMGEGSFDLAAIEHELQEGTGLENLNRISLDLANRSDFANRLSRVIGQRFMAANTNQASEAYQQHTFMLDDGEALQVAARQSEAGLSLQLGSGNQELMRLIQQHADEIRAHLKNELNIEIDLQLKQDSGEAQSFGADEGKGRNATGTQASADASLSGQNDNHSDTRLNPRYLGFNNNEWVG